jgi:uncharacterized protein YneF (UPF0154 family)
MQKPCGMDAKEKPPIKAKRLRSLWPSMDKTFRIEDQINQIIERSCQHSWF